MSFKKHFEVRRDTAKVEKIKEVKGLDCLVHCGDTTEINDNGLVPWGTAADHERANQALVNHFARR